MFVFAPKRSLHPCGFKSAVELVHRGDVGRVLAALEPAHCLRTNTSTRCQLRLAPACCLSPLGELLSQDRPQGFRGRIIAVALGCWQRRYNRRRVT